MKTVLFIEKKALDGREEVLPSYREYEGLFRQCLEVFDIHVCLWDSEALVLSEAVPDLLRIVDRSTQWRAVVVSDLSFGHGKQKESFRVANPFDLYDFVQVDGALSLCPEAVAQPDPLVRMTRMLGGIPRAYRNLSFSREDYPDLPLEEVPSLPDGRPLMERYHLGCTKPVDLLVISPRNIHDEFLTVDNGRSASYESEGLYPHQSFAESSGYADRARFVVVDRSLPPSVSYGRDMLRFWMTVMTLATHDSTRGSLQFGQLYRAEVEFDEDDIRANLISHYADCCQVRDKLKERMDAVRRERIPSETDKVFLPDFRKDVRLSFNLLDTEKMFLDGKRFGMFSDVPTDDYSELAGQKRRIKHEAEVLGKEPRRALRQAEREFQGFDLPSDEEVLRSPLNRHTTDLLVGELEEIEDRIAVANPAAALAFDDIDESVKKEEDAIKEQMSHRVSFSAVAIALGIAAGTLAVGFAPFIFGLTADIQFNLRALIATILVALVLVAICFLDVRAQKLILDQCVRDFNAKITSVIDTLKRKCDEVGNRMSDFASFRRGWHFLKKNDETPKFVGDEEEYLARTHADLCVEIDRIRNDAMFSPRYDEAYAARSFMAWSAADDMIRSGRIYNFSLSAEDSTARYNTVIDGAARTKVPFAAITSLDVVPINPVSIGRVTR